MKAISHSGWFHFVLLLVWLAIGTGLRFTHLASKPPWNDEFSTLVFSLGNSFRPVPLDRAIALDTLLMPLQPNPEAGIRHTPFNDREYSSPGVLCADSPVDEAVSYRRWTGFSVGGAIALALF